MNCVKSGARRPAAWCRAVPRLPLQHRDASGLLDDVRELVGEQTAAAVAVWRQLAGGEDDVAADVKARASTSRAASAAARVGVQAHGTEVAPVVRFGLGSHRRWKGAPPGDPGGSIGGDRRHPWRLRGHLSRHRGVGQRVGFMLERRARARPAGDTGRAGAGAAVPHRRRARSADTPATRAVRRRRRGTARAGPVTRSGVRANR